VAQHQVHVLDGLARRAFAQVVNRRYHEQSLAAAIEDERQLAEIRSAYIAQFGQLAGLQNSHEARLGEAGLEGGVNVALGRAGARTHEDRAQKTARDRQQMRHEQQRDVAAERGGYFLFHLGDVAMVADLVGAEILVDFGEQLLDRRRAARAGRARLRIDDYRRGLDQVAPDKRQQCEQRAGRKTSGVRDHARLAKFMAMELAQPVNRLLEEIWRGMLDAV